MSSVDVRCKYRLPSNKENSCFFDSLMVALILTNFIRKVYEENIVSVEYSNCIISMINTNILDVTKLRKILGENTSSGNPESAIDTWEKIAHSVKAFFEISIYISDDKAYRKQKVPSVSVSDFMMSGNINFNEFKGDRFVIHNDYTFRKITSAGSENVTFYDHKENKMKTETRIKKRSILKSENDYYINLGLKVYKLVSVVMLLSKFPVLGLTSGTLPGHYISYFKPMYSKGTWLRYNDLEKFPDFSNPDLDQPGMIPELMFFKLCK